MWPQHAADSRRPSALTERGSLKTSTTGTAQSYVYQIPTPVSVSALPMAVHQYAVDFASAQRHCTDDRISPACHGIGRHCDWLERLCAGGAAFFERAGQAFVVLYLGGIRLSPE